MTRLSLLLLVCMLPSTAWSACPFPAQVERLEVQLYFGQSIEGHGLVSRRAWQQFVADTLTPALPDGFTVLEGSGEYRDRTLGIGHEPTELVVAVGDDGDAFRAHVAGIVDAYKRRFAQRSVGLVSHAVCAQF